MSKWVFLLLLCATPLAADSREFWSFRPIRSPSLPVLAAESGAWARTPVDAFVRARLDAAGIKPVAEADRRTLLRRINYDLTGLPPTPTSVDAFLEDDAPDAFDRVVDRLLASTAHGERWGRHWLDLVRYSDSAGETADYPLPEAYRYRNYVIDAFNRGMPYDQFVREQIAGDILARKSNERYAERSTATGFIALSRRFGYDSEAYHHQTIQDTIDTMGQTFLGLSLGCARCHDHKYDPVSMADYYGLYGIFASTRYPFAGSEEKTRMRSLVPLLPPEEAFPLRESFERDFAQIEEKLRALMSLGKRRTLGSLDDIDGDFELQAESRGGSSGTPVSPWRFSGDVSIEELVRSPYSHVYRRGRVAVNFPGDAGEHGLWQAIHAIPDGGHFSPRQVFFNVDLRVASAPPKYETQSTLYFQKVRQLVESDELGAYRLFLGGGLGERAAVELFVRREHETGATLVARNGDRRDDIHTLEIDTWYNVQLVLDLEARTYAGTVATSQKSASFAGKAFAADWDGAIDHILVDDKGTSPPGMKPILQLDNIAVRTSAIRPLPRDPGALHLNEIDEKLALEKLTKEEQKHRRRAAEPLRQQLVTLFERGPYPQAYGVVEGNPHDVRVHERGDPMTPGKQAPRRWLEIFGGDPVPVEHRGSGRTHLADWLTRRDNPLTSRVFVNRVWQHHFGHGLARTENDFGTRGEPPTHPELLDSLASRFVDGGWSVKRLHRSIVLSSTYRLSCHLDSRAVSLDPEIRLRWRFERRRLGAEALRDSLLFLSGGLEYSVANRHPFPYEDFTQHKPFRAVYGTRSRSVYIMTQRTLRHPFLSLFDAPDRNACVSRRTTTIVPTQALYLLNSRFVHDQSTILADRLYREAGTDEESVTALAYRMALGRPPSADELDRVRSFLHHYRKVLVDSGEPAERHRTLSVAALARSLFSRNEFLYVE